MPPMSLNWLQRSSILIIFHVLETNFRLSTSGPRNQKGIVTQMTCPYGFQYNDSGCRICRCRKAAEMKNELIVPRQKFAGRDCEWSKGSSSYLFSTRLYLIKNSNEKPKIVKRSPQLLNRSKKGRWNVASWLLPVFLLLWTKWKPTWDGVMLTTKMQISKELQKSRIYWRSLLSHLRWRRFRSDYARNAAHVSVHRRGSYFSVKEVILLFSVSLCKS